MTILHPGQQLLPGQSRHSNNKLYTFIMQEDGNAVLYDRNSKPLWSTNTGGLITPRDFTMQTDGNLVLYSTDGTAQWASNTSGNPGAFFNIQDDGNLVVYRAGSKTETADNALWAAGSNDPSNLGSPSQPVAAPPPQAKVPHEPPPPHLHGPALPPSIGVPLHPPSGPAAPPAPAKFPPEPPLRGPFEGGPGPAHLPLPSVRPVPQSSGLDNGEAR
jgi:hypothetical protein